MRQWLVDRKVLFTQSFRFIVLLFAIKVLEVVGVLLFTTQGVISIYNGLLGFVVDVFYLHLILLFFMLISMFIKKSTINAITKLFRIIVNILIFIYILFIIYFLTTGTALDQAIYIHTLDEMRFIILKSVDYPYLYLIGTLVFVVGFLYGFNRLLKHINCGNNTRIASFIIALLSPVLLVFASPRQGYFVNEFQYMLVENKEAFFIGSSYDYWVRNKKANLSNMEFDDIQKFHTDMGPFTYIQDSFPFLRLDNQEDVIGKYFRVDSVRPNFVFIACESLSRDFSGEEAYLGSFTPFLDSLENHSLYWENCLSSTERTFGVLPALLGSLPFAQQGFAALAEAGYPSHLTLMSLLKANGYFTSYFHGGPLGFDFLYDFIKYQQPDYIFNEPKEGAIINQPENKEVSWGLYDDELFAKSMEIMNSQHHIEPRLDVFLTLTTHAPFNIPDRPFWEKQFDKHLKSSDWSPEKRKRAQEQKFRLSAFMYLDHSLKQLLYDYKKNFDFEHTIFIITGDHRMGTPARNSLEKYHIPLIIYSPMLKSHQKFSAVVNHLALPSTINSFMKANYKYSAPDSVAWVMQSLDTMKTYRNIYAFPTMRNSRVIEEYVYKDYYLIKDQLYKIKQGLEIQPIENDSIKQIIINKMERYDKYNYFACYNNRLFPYDILPHDKSMEVLIDNHWTKDIIFNSSTEYSSILHNYLFDMKKNKGFKLKVSFDVNNLDSPPDSLPMVVFNIITKTGENNIWKGFRMRGANGHMAATGKTTEVIIKQNIDFERYNFEDGTYLKMYFWNNKRVNCQISNLSVELVGLH